MLRTFRINVILLLLVGLLPPFVNAADSAPTLLVGSDRRASIRLDGDWHYIVDPYNNGYYDFRMSPRPDGYFLNEKPGPGDKLIEYDFSRSPTLKVPGDWNSQRDSLFFYEGTIWYEKDFQYQPKPHTRAFLHIGAANYISHAWVNGRKACDHEGGFTPFDCEVTNLIHAGSNFVVIYVNNQRTRDGAPTLNTDWWNYGGLTRDVSLIETPEVFIDDYSLQLQRGDTDVIAGFVHVSGASAGTPVKVSIQALSLNQVASTDAQGRAGFTLTPKDLQRWSPRNPKLYDVDITAASDHVKDEIGFRTIEVQGDQILL
ncbi:MAG TPA: beta-glucuronidase, partial [Candidatus Angelobacter sp.]|nr:beta-glucuronidase [Candidatus Angelobacter sp.]